MSCFEQSSFANGFPVNWAILGGGQLGTEMRRKKPARVLHKESPNVQQFWPLSVSVVLSLQYFKPWIGVPASKCSAGTFSFSRRCSPHRITKIEVQWRTDWGFPNSSKLLVGQFHDICSMAKPWCSIQWSVPLDIRKSTYETMVSKPGVKFLGNGL
jgi:hypothetical protein